MKKEEIICNLEKLTQEKGYIYSFAHILLKEAFSDVRELGNIDWQNRLIHQELSFVAGLILKYPLKFEIIDEATSKSQIERTYQFLKELHNAFIEPYRERLLSVIKDSSSFNDADNKENVVFGSGLALSEAIFYGNSGAYDFQLVNFAVKRYAKDKNWLQRNKGLDLDVLSRFYYCLRRLQHDKLKTCSNVSCFEEFCKKALYVFCFSKEEVNNFQEGEIESILNAFSVTPGCVNKDLDLPGKYNVINSHPIIRLDKECYFVPILFNLAQSIYESPFYWMNEDDGYKIMAAKNRGEAAEDIVEDLLVKVFGRDRTFKQVKVKDKKGDLTDIDLLAVAGNKAIVFQVKSKKLTIFARCGNDEKIKKDFSEAIQESYEQGIISRNAILTHEACLFNAEGKEIKLDDTINDVYIFCVTADHYPAVVIQTRHLLQKKSASDPYPIALNLFDLEILAFYLNDPFKFLYYSRQRLALYDQFMGQSEIDLLAYHLNQKLYPLKDEESGKRIDWALVEGMASLIDAHFPAACGYQPCTEAIEKLHAKWYNPDFQKIIEQLKQSKKSGFTDAIFFLYDLEGKGADCFIEQAKKLKNKCLNERKSLRFYMMGKDDKTIVCYICDYGAKGNLFRHLFEYCKIKKYQTKANLCLGLGGFADGAELFEGVIFNNDPWVKDDDMEILAKKYFSKGRPVNLKTGEKLGRNDPCFCGSGIKYKKCCGN